MEIQTDALMTGAELLEKVRGMRSGTFIVPRDGHERKRAIALKLGDDELGGYVSTLTAEQLERLDHYETLLNGLVDAGYLLANDAKPYWIGKGGIHDDESFGYDSFGYDITYVVPGLVPYDDDPVRTADDLLDLIKEEGRFVYTTRFARGVPGFDTTLAQYCGEASSEAERLLDLVDELRDTGRIKVKSTSYAGSHQASKGERIDGLPSMVHVLKAA